MARARADRRDTVDSTAALASGRSSPLLERLALAPWSLALIAVLVVLAYGHTLDVPFYLDDYSSLVENPGLADWAELWRRVNIRFAGYLSFALNYRLHGLDVTGYHVVNILIHLGTSVLVFALVRLLLRTPVLAGQADPTLARWLPLLVALLFALHPLQTQAVTYVVQRIAALATLWYVAAMVCYLQARLAESRARSWRWAAAAAVCALLAFFTKQNAATLPIALVVIELLFLQAPLRRLVAVGGVALVLLFLAWFAYATIRGVEPFSLQALDAITRDNRDFTRTEYFATQLGVLWTYIRLFFLPVNLHLDYDVAVATSLTGPNVLLAAALHLVVLVLALSQWRRRPLLAFGVVFYYLAHAVESSILPIRHLAFEHRTYLPNLGLCLISGYGLLRLPAWFGARRGAYAIAAVVMVLAAATWLRNQEWRHPEAFWQDNARLTPHSPRPLDELAKLYLAQGRSAEALSLLRQSLAKRGVDGRAAAVMRPSAALNLILALFRLERYDEALAAIRQLRGQPLGRELRATLLRMEGDIAAKRRDFAAAEAAYSAALRLMPGELTTSLQLARALAAAGAVQRFQVLYAGLVEREDLPLRARQALESLRARLNRTPAGGS